LAGVDVAFFAAPVVFLAAFCTPVGFDVFVAAGDFDFDLVVLFGLDLVVVDAAPAGAGSATRPERAARRV